LRNAIVPFDKQPRRFGASKWSFARRVKLFIDTITGFSHFPIRSISIVGALCSGAGFLYAIYALVQYLFGNIQPGWTSIVVLVLVLGGLQIVMIGVLGEYFARACSMRFGRGRATSSNASRPSWEVLPMMTPWC
jgi:polyisoprenyl-phosphate glycosyltransferase